VLALAIGIGLLVTACTSGSTPQPSGSSSPTSSSASPGPTTTATADGGEFTTVAGGPKPPAVGAWTGAWVKPAVPNQQGRVDAVAAFEKAIGRPLDLVHVYHQWTEAFPSAADLQFVQQGKVLMISGADDPIIEARATALKEMGNPVLLRWRWEMNRKNLAAAVGSPAQYIAAWKHIRTIFTAVGTTNVGWVWCPLATDFNATNGPSYYPGDDQVDWLCTDVYPGPTHDSFAAVASEFMAWAAGHHKPVIIGEYGVESSNPAQAGWIAGAETYARQNPQIKAMVYFDADRVENGVTRDFRLEGTTAPLHAFQHMIASAYFSPAKG
jgi:hypothetical protein